MEEIFAAALDRLQAGEPLAAIVASYPAEVQAETQRVAPCGRIGRAPGDSAGA